MALRRWLVAALVAFTVGLFFASVSTLDFVVHLDRQTHELHCSFAPGLVEGQAAEGCQVTLMSPYSSVFRTWVWGGIPISLAAMAMFAFLVYRAFDVFGRPPRVQRHGALVLWCASFIPVFASIVMGSIAFTQLHAACKLCIGIYIASALGFVASLGAWRAAVGMDVASEPQPQGWALRIWAPAVLQIGAFVGVPMVVYLALVPDFSRYLGSCGSLPAPDDPYGVLVPLDDHARGVPAVEVFDPLCPACRAFEERLEASDLPERLHRRALLFPLDAACNWMVPDSMHPGACAVSEAILCAHRSGLGPTEVIDWAFANQEEILEAEKASPGAARDRVTREFPSLRECVGSPEVQADLNKSLRWAVANEITVSTPQLFVDRVKLCDADTDLGLDWALTRLLDDPPPVKASAEPPATPTQAREAAAASGVNDRPGAAPTSRTKPAAAAPRPVQDEDEPSKPSPAEDSEPPPSEPEPEPEPEPKPQKDPPGDTEPADDEADRLPSLDAQTEPAEDSKDSEGHS